ncbi:MAG: transglutaminase family protein [Deltaproteobacteria bacterium]|nr:transglutaminase family protein [Deltaproteobacteria bacterium]
MKRLHEYLAATPTIDCDHPSIIKSAHYLVKNCSTEMEKAVALFSFVRDSIPYSLYMISVFEEDFMASRVLTWGKGYCVQKAVLLTAMGRSVGIPSRLAFAKIKNHKVPAKIIKMAGGNIFPRHGYTQFYLNETWLSAAPTFDSKLCNTIGVPTVDFDGRHDAILPEKDLHGGPYIEYLETFGSYADLPFEWIAAKISQTLGPDKRPWRSKADMPSL